MSKTREPQSCAISFANGKGGVGKTSLIANLSVRAARDAHVALLDYDGQQSLARWWELRGIAYGSVLVTSDLFETVSDLCERHDLTKAEFTERAFLQFIETLKGGKGNGVARD